MTTTAIDLGECKLLEALHEVLGPVAGLDIVDAGCGEGELGRALARRGARVIGVDPFMDPQELVHEGEGTFRLVQAHADSMPLRAASVDLVIFNFSLHHVPAEKLSGALAEARRVLRPSGRLYVGEPMPEGPNHYVMAPFHDETAVRTRAQQALRDHAGSLFRQHRQYRYRDPRSYGSFDVFAERMIANTRFNADYQASDVLAPEVRKRFDEMVAMHGGRFDQPVRIDLYF